ncbi:hypothetical protein GF323_01435 [Candidatus Woesearchaeota archaeon]|nr:hypothetical protein [Candidatus Woesearchaeota archaeon]
MKIMIILLALFLFLYGCDTIVCEQPYMQVGSECCLDKDNNKICDSDEAINGETNMVITEKEPKIIEKEVKKYVCWNGLVVDSPEKCPKKEEKEDEEAGRKISIPSLEKQNERGTVIKNVNLTPACPNGVRGGRVYYKVGTVPDEMVFELKEAGKKYREVYRRDGLYEGDVYFAVCEKCSGNQIEFRVEEGKAYIFRIMFNQSTVYSRIEYSNEHLIDTREGSGYMLKVC